MMATTVSDDSLKGSIAVSTTLHVLLLLLLYFGLPILFTPPPVHHDPVPFEIVDIADITNTRVEEPKPLPEPPAPPPKPAPRMETPSPPQPAVPKEEEIAIPKPVEKPKPMEKKDEKPKPDPLASVLKNVEKLKAAETPKTNSQATTQKEEEAKPLAPTLSTRLTISEEDNLRRQIQQCWNVPIGARDVQNLVVEVTIAVNPDRTVARADVVDTNRMATDPFFRAAAEAALRALKNPQCSPLNLPPDKYDQWKVIDFTFDPRDML